VEAENVLTNDLWALDTEYDGFYGEGTAMFLGNAPKGGKPLGRSSLRFFIDNPGRYTMMMRAYKNDTANPDFSNDCYTRLLGFEGYRGVFTKTYNAGQAGTYTWNTKHYPKKRFGLDPLILPEYNLTQRGVYELQIAGRSQHFRLDRIVLYNEDHVSRNFAKNYRRVESPVLVPTSPPTLSPSGQPSSAPTASAEPTAVPTGSRPPSQQPSLAPTASAEPSAVSSEAPTASPSVSSEPTRPPTFATYYLVNAGSPDEDPSLFTANKDRTFGLEGIEIVGAEPYDAEFFRTHRWSGKMTYTFPSFLPFSATNVTLGFAEIFDGNCNSGPGSRVMDVTVNGAPFLTDYDALAGNVTCRTARLEHGEFPADADGSIAIKFTASSDRPFVSLLEVQTVED